MGEGKCVVLFFKDNLITGHLYINMMKDNFYNIYLAAMS